MSITLQILIILFGPGILMFLLNGKKIGKILSPIVMCYVVGIAIATFGIFEVDVDLSMEISKGTILIAIPLLLFSADIIAWFKHAGSTVLSFFYAIIAALISCVLFSFVFQSYIPEIWDPAAMLVGVYTGGTANLQAVGVGIEAAPDIIVGINTVEMLVGGVYLLFLTSLAPWLFAKFLPAYKATEEEMDQEEIYFQWKDWKQMILSILISLVIGGLVVVTISSIWGDVSKHSAKLILLLSSLGVLASFSPRIRNLKGSFEAGDYLIMMFCIAVGMMSDLREILDKSLFLVAFTAVTWLTTIIIHLFLSYISKIDRDTTIITSTAALYGPPFVGQIASIIGNRKIVFAGIATGLIGYAIGNFLGISIHQILQSLLS